MSFLLFVLIVIAAVIVVQAGAIALELTGLDKHVARFQAVSCFTGTGFTTREAETITANPQRRRIASILMIVGFAGFVTLIGTFAGSVKDHDAILQFPLSFLSSLIPQKYYSWLNLGFYLLVGLALWRAFKSSRLVARANKFLRKHLEKRDLISPVNFNELMVATGGWGVCRVDIREGNPAVGKTLHELELHTLRIQALAIERNSKTLSMPKSDTRLEKNDLLICFGKLTAIRKKLLDSRKPAVSKPALTGAEGTEDR